MNPSILRPPDVRTRIFPPDALCGKPDAMRFTGCPAKEATAVVPCGSPQRVVPLVTIGAPRTSHTKAGKYALGAAVGAGEGAGDVAGCEGGGLRSGVSGVVLAFVAAAFGAGGSGCATFSDAGEQAAESP